eukprot:2528765-Prorocentrum_lima.AAC.1
MVGGAGVGLVLTGPLAAVAAPPPGLVGAASFQRPGQVGQWSHPRLPLLICQALMSGKGQR